MKKKSKFDISNLTNRELEILNTLWNSPKPLTASEIFKLNTDTTMNTIQAVLRKLLRNEFIEVADIVYSGTVLCRSYKASVSANDYALSKITSDYETYGKDITKTSLVAALLDCEPDSQKVQEDIEHLEALLAEYKRNIAQRSN